MKGKNLLSIIGAGNHGTLLALLISQTNKYHVRLLDTSEESLSRSHIYMENLLQNRMSKGKIDDQDYYTIFSNISVSTNLSSISSSHCIIECINEHIGLKSNIISAIDRLIPTDSLIISTTSSLSLTKLASASSHPERVLGLHFFALPHASQIVEIISGLQTSEQNVQKGIALVETLGKEYSLSSDKPGFIANKIIFSFINESVGSFEKGISSVEEIDKTIKKVTGMHLGPFEMADEIGLDVVLDQLNILHQGYAEDKYKPSQLIARYVSAGWLGKKSGRGFYRY